MGTATLDTIVDSRLNNGKITVENITDDLLVFSDVFDKLAYISRILTYTELGLRRNILLIEDGVKPVLLNVQQSLVEIARGKVEEDKLTGLPNRAGMDRRAKEQAGKYCILIVDIDHFKQYNDGFNHEVGDVVLKNVVKIVQESVRKSEGYFEKQNQNYLARMGGEEFYVALNNVDSEQARYIAERIREAVKSRANIKTADELELQGSSKAVDYLRKTPVTVSIGVADENQGTSPENVRVSADKALFVAKDFGRDRVIVWGDNPFQDLTLKQKAAYHTANLIRDFASMASTIGNDIKKAYLK